MKFIQHSSLPLFFSLLTAAVGFVGAQDFQEIDGVLPNMGPSLYITAQCTGSSVTYTNIMWTVEPADSVTVSTSPPNLVSVDKSGNFQYNMDVAASATSGGVKIGYPANQLTYLSVSNAVQVQVLDGFTMLSKIGAMGGSTVTADLSSNGMRFIVNAEGASSVIAKSGATVMGGNVQGASSVQLAVPSALDMKVQGASSIQVDGSIDGLRVEGASSAIATGDVTGEVVIQGASSVTAASCSGDIKAEDVSTCTSGEPTIDVTITESPMTLSGTRVCTGGWGGSTNSGGWTGGSWSSGSFSMHSYRTGVFGAGAAAAYMIM